MKTIRVYLALIVVSLSCCLMSQAQQKENPITIKPTEQAALKDFNGYFPWEPPTKLADWEKRRTELKQQLQIAVGLWPMPELPPIKPTIHGKVERDDFTVERVFFESLPGHFVTGSLFRPKNVKGKCPAVLCPHGHWNNGRFFQENEKTFAKQLKDGEESFDPSGRYPLQARCVQLARMGCVVFHYDMIGYADSVQIPYEIAHRFKQRRPEMEGAEYGFYSPQAEARLQTIMGLQTLNSIRAVDFVCSLPDVDQEKIGCTGASGGGTQTFVLAALDERVKVAFPAVMVSTAMQGGCTCENCSYLRVGTGNIELAALIAPRPLGMTAANDWTKEMETKGYPQLQQLYKLYGKPEHVQLFPFLQFGHNYNQPSRMAMYEFMNKHLELDQASPIKERDFVPLTREELTVWNDKYPAPKNGPEVEKATLKTWREMNEQSMVQLEIKDLETYMQYLSITSPFWKQSLDPENKYSKPGNLVAFRSGDLIVHVLQNAEKVKRQINPRGWELKQVVLHSESDKAARVKGDRDYAGFTYGYNLSPFAQQVQQILKETTKKQNVIYVAEPGTEAYVAAAATLDSVTKVRGIALCSVSVSFAKIKDYDDAHFHPGAAKYGDLKGLIMQQNRCPMFMPKFVDETTQQTIERAKSVLPFSKVHWVNEVTDEELNKWLQEITTKK